MGQSDPTANQPLPDTANKVVAARAILVGGGIASLAAATFLIRDCGMAGSDITVLEELAILGGRRDAAGSAKHGFSTTTSISPNGSLLQQRCMIRRF